MNGCKRLDFIVVLLSKNDTHFTLIAILSEKFLSKAQNNSLNFQRTIPGSLWSIKLCERRGSPSSTQSYTAVPLTLNHVKVSPTLLKLVEDKL